MSRADEILAKAIAWATQDRHVRRLLLVGSRARVPPPDELADIDLQVFVETSERYTRDRSWLTQIGDVWVCVSDEYLDGDVRVPTRLVIFEGGVKVDFAFYPADFISRGIHEGRPHRVLLDRGGPPSSARTAAAAPGDVLPSAAQFASVVEEFWFEAYHVGKYLARGEAWLAYARHGATVKFLRTMIDWHERIVLGRESLEEWEGERSRVSPETWEASLHTLRMSGRDESWRALLAAMDLFRRLAMEVAKAAGFSYPIDVDQHLSTYVTELRRVDHPPA